MTIPRNLSFLAQGASSTGVLSVPYGGTGVTSMTAGYIPYGNGAGAFNSSANLFWDSANNRLGIGTSSPAYQLDVANSIKVFSATQSSINFGVSGASQYAKLEYDDTTGNFNLNNPRAFPIRFLTNNTEAARIFSSGGVSIGNTTDPGAGNLRFATTGTNGIYFGSSARLDDYETGTWTPSDASGAGLTFTSATGVYTKIGRLVTCTFGITFPVTASVATVTIGNLPFTTLSSGTPNPSGGSITYTGAAVTAAGFATGSGGTSVSLYGASGAAIGNSTFSTFILRAQFTYTSN